MLLSPDGYLDEYRSLGIASVPGLLDSTQLSAAREWLARLIALGDQLPASYEPEFEPGALDAPRVRKLRRLYWNDPAFWSPLLVISRIAEVARKLVGADVALVFHAAFLKPARAGSPVALHQDQALWRYVYPNAVSIWVALARAGADNGALLGCPRSHEAGLLPHKPISGHPWHGGVDWAAEGLAAPVRYDVSPGDALAWHRYFVHGSGPNVGEDDRWATVFVFVDRTQPGVVATDRSDF